jgi:hypothetical protein
MNAIRKSVITSLALPLLFALTALAQQAQTPQSAAVKEPEYVTEKGFKGKVFEIKHREPFSLYRAIYTLGSGFKGATMSYSNEDKIIVVRDFPENIAAIEEAIKRLDVPQPARPDIELHIHFLLASNVEGGNNQLPAEINDAVKQLRLTLAYKNYYLASSIVQRTKDGARGLNGGGNAEVGSPLFREPTDLHYSALADGISITGSPDSPAIELRSFQFELNTPSSAGGRALIKSDLSLREGEKVVVGTASLKDKALVLVVTAKIIK